MEDFAGYVAAERERLVEKRATVLEAHRQAEQDLAEIESEFHAITAYEAAKSGKKVAVASTRARGGGRRRHGSRREEVMNVVHANSQGLKRREILEALGVKGDKSAEMSVSNALTALLKQGNLNRDEEGFYVPVAAAQAAVQAGNGAEAVAY